MKNHPLNPVPQHYTLSCSLFLLPVIRHMPHLGSPSAAMRIQSILCTRQQPTATDFSVLGRQSKNNLLVRRKTTHSNILVEWQWQFFIYYKEEMEKYILCPHTVVM